MQRKEYSAGAVKLSFWFVEFRKTVQLLYEGNSFEDIKDLALGQNIFAAPTTFRANQIFNTVSGRIKALNSSFIPLFIKEDLATQKLIALIADMAYDTLFFDFVYEVVREKMLIGSNELLDSDIRIFFKDKQQQSAKVASWTDATLTRLGASYKTMLFEAGLIDKAKSVRKILHPIIDPELIRWLNEANMTAYIKALSGVA